MDDAAMMGLALDVARRGWGRTAPNPAVGAVIVHEGLVVAEGWTQPPGAHHAEVHALQQAGDVRGATMYVTLEPCCHWGRTPPCTDAILAAGIRRVVVGTVDPFPLVAGQGLERLRTQGVEVLVGVREAECRRQILGFLRAVTEGLPEVTLKAALSLDGRIASASGESRWITGPAARRRGHELRDTHDVLLVGIGTILADNPELTTRLPGGRDAQIAIVDTSLRLPRDARVLGRRPLVYAAPGATGDVPAEVVFVPRADAGVSLRAVLADLARRGHHRVLVEGGGRVHHSLLAEGLVDRLELFVNGRVLAGGPGFVSGSGFRLSEAPSFRFVGGTPVGDDFHLVLERFPCSPAS